MKNFNKTRIIGVDAGYGNMKTANSCFRTGIDTYETEPLFTRDISDPHYRIFTTLSEEKANQREMVKVPMDRLRDIVPESYTVKQTEDFLIKAAEYYHRNIIRQRNRDSR